MTAKKRSGQRSDRLFKSLECIAARSSHSEDDDQEILGLTSIAGQPITQLSDTSKTPRMKKFRSQLLHQWLVQNLAPCKVADIGGGKGLLSYLLIQSGWDAVVIDPFEQTLPVKFKDIATGSRVKIPPLA